MPRAQADADTTPLFKKHGVLSNGVTRGVVASDVVQVSEHEREEP